MEGLFEEVFQEPEGKKTQEEKSEKKEEMPRVVRPMCACCVSHTWETEEVIMHRQNWGFLCWIPDTVLPEMLFVASIFSFSC